MNLQDFLFTSVEFLRQGDILRLDELFPMLEAARDKLDDWALLIEQEPQPPGLEALDEAMLEALDYFSEALDYLELAASEDLPELADFVSSRTQDAIDTLRFVQKQAKVQSELLASEISCEER